MHGRLSGCLLVLSGLLLGACTEADDPPLFVDAAYQVRCLRCEPRAQDNDPRELNAIDGEQGLDLQCNVTGAEGRRSLNFSVAFNAPGSSSDDFRLQLVQVNLDSSGPGNECLVVVQEGANTYEGDCTADEPSEDEPCRVELEEEAGIVSGTLWCQRIPNRADNNLWRHVVEPGSSDEPAPIAIHGCSGL